MRVLLGSAAGGLQGEHRDAARSFGGAEQTAPEILIWAAGVVASPFGRIVFS